MNRTLASRIVNIASAVTLVSLAVLPFAASAVSFEQVGTTLGLGSKDLKATVITFIQWILGLLALIAVVMILYAGFMLVSGGGGNPERAASAKTILTAAIIGLVIVLIAWAIVIFAVNVISNSTA